jgi:RNA polymerase sigma factor (sigma-70 family)
MVNNPADVEAQLSDTELAKQTAIGDRMAYGLIMRRWQRPLWRMAWRYTRDGGESEDIVQGVFVSLWRRLILEGSEQAPIPHDLGAYLRKATLNACRDWSRRRAVRAFFFKASALEPERIAVEDDRHSTEHGDELDRLDHLISQLPDGLKAPLILCALEGVGHREAAIILGLTPKAIEARISRAKQQLRKQWPDDIQ